MMAGGAVVLIRNGCPFFFLQILNEIDRKHFSSRPEIYVIIDRKA